MTAFTSATKPVDRALAEIVLRDLDSDAQSVQVGTAMIMAAIAEYSRPTSKNSAGPARGAGWRARQIATYLCRELTDLSLPKSARPSAVTTPQ